MLDKASTEHVIIDYKDIYQDVKEDKIVSPVQMPYFEGDFFPTVLEDFMKQLVKEEEQEKSAESDEAPEEAPESTEAPAAKRRKKTKKSKQKNRSTRPRKSSKRVPSDLRTKLFQTMEKNRDVSKLT